MTQREVLSQRNLLVLQVNRRLITLDERIEKMKMAHKFEKHNDYENRMPIAQIQTVGTMLEQ